MTGAKLETVQLRLNCEEETEPSPLNIRTSEGRPTNILQWDPSSLTQFQEYISNVQDPTKPWQLRGDLKIIFRLSK